MGFRSTVPATEGMRATVGARRKVDPSKILDHAHTCSLLDPDSRVGQQPGVGRNHPADRPEAARAAQRQVVGRVAQRGGEPQRDTLMTFYAAGLRAPRATYGRPGTMLLRLDRVFADCRSIPTHGRAESPPFRRTGGSPCPRGRRVLASAPEVRSCSRPAVPSVRKCSRLREGGAGI